MSPPRIVRAEVTTLNQIDIWFDEAVRPEGVEDLVTWHLEVIDGPVVPITEAQHDDRIGDRVTLRTELAPNTSYRLLPIGDILDLSENANALDLDDSRNVRELEIGTSLTITLGASPYHNLNIAVHDASLLDPSRESMTQDRIALRPVNGVASPTQNTGLLRFDWRSALVEATGLGSADQILDASFTLTPESGSPQTIEIRRCLRKWSDPATETELAVNAFGAPTWRESAHPMHPWSQPGAGALGGSGQRLIDYRRGFDLADRVDGTIEMTSLDETITFAGELVTEAFRFWFDFPQVDNGYALRLASGSSESTAFESAEAHRGVHSPFLTITYDLDRSAGALDFAVPDDASWNYFRGRSTPTGEWTAVDYDDSRWLSGRTGIGYGDDDDNTVLADMKDNYLVVFARHTFELDHLTSVARAILDISYDDGVVVHLNGRELERINVGPGTVTHETPASATVTDAPFNQNARLELPVRLLRPGTNTIAVSIHNVILKSSDLTFIPRLELVRRAQLSETRVGPLRKIIL
ncbi:MAG: Ig-like domain-containing protein, partial [Planctomycetota bacterium]